MTDRERIYTTKIYMEKLSNGMNPFDGTELPEDTILNNVNLCRAFTLVADILDQVIKNDYRVSKAVKTRKESFRITDAQRQAIKISKEPVGINAISERISKVLDSNVKGIPGVTITGWLESLGFLTREEHEGKRIKVATKQGNDIGIYTRTFKYGDKEYLKTVYEVNAQGFIIDNLDGIAAF